MVRSFWFFQFVGIKNAGDVCSRFFDGWALYGADFSINMCCKCVRGPMHCTPVSVIAISVEHRGFDF